MIGRTIWAIAEGYIPSASTAQGRALESHETACILNAGDRDAHVEIMIYFVACEPAGPYRVTVPARRTLQRLRPRHPSTSLPRGGRRDPQSCGRT